MYLQSTSTKLLGSHITYMHFQGKPFIASLDAHFHSVRYVISVLVFVYIV